MNLEVFIGWDRQQAVSWRVACASLQRHARRPVSVKPIGIEQLQMAGFWERGQSVQGGQIWDDTSNLPCSTEFSIARFGVPLLAERGGWTLFCDLDVIFRADVWDLLYLADTRYAVMVVKHRHEPGHGKKMRGQAQRPYPRKNWSSFVLWNMRHASNTARPWFQMVNTWHRDKLHAFEWLQDDQIGELPEEWNWLDGHSSEAVDAKVAHFTRGVPDMPGWEETRYAQEWRRYAEVLR